MINKYIKYNENEQLLFYQKQIIFKFMKSVISNIQISNEYIKNTIK